MINELAGVSESARQLHVYLNVKTAKIGCKLGKCHTLEIAHRNVTCTELDSYIDHYSERP